MRAERRTLNVILTVVVDLLVSFIVVIDTITSSVNSFSPETLWVLWGLLEHVVLFTLRLNLLAII